MLLRLGGHISNCLERATDAERRALETTDSSIRSDNEMLAQSWRLLASSYQFVQSLERFLADTAHGKSDGVPPEFSPVMPEQPAAPEGRPIIRRRRVKQEISFKDRLIKSAHDAREQALRLPPGAERERLLRKARQSDAAADIDVWISTPGSRSPDSFNLGKKPKA
jgi:hypothetical protein